MDGDQPPPASLVGAFYPDGYPPMMPQLVIPSRSQSTQSIPMESLAGYSNSDNPPAGVTPASPTSLRRPRRRQPQHGADQVKHRRTRSGCYTCRQRRVKCDETRPICDRCRKGKRDCTYPGDASSSTLGQSRGKEKEPLDGLSPPESDADADEREPLSSIPDDEDEDDAGDFEISVARSAGQITSGVSTSAAHSIPSPATMRPSTNHRSSTGLPHGLNPLTRSPAPTLIQTTAWSALPNDVRSYLQYHQEHIFHHHYAFKYDGEDFLKTTFLQTAINDQSPALLYAVVAFAAYHRSLSQDDSQISIFLSYYNQSIGYLQKALTSKRHTVATLLTILQLATIEEFLGDWANLLGHQKAAFQLLTSLFTPQTIMQDETRRKIVSWYMRFDLFAGMMSGAELSLGREWFAACTDYYVQQARDKPDELGAQFEEFFSTSRLLATDVALVFAAKSRNTISDEQFTFTVAKLMADFREFNHRIQSVFTDPSCFVKSFPDAPLPSSEDINDFRDPTFLYGGRFSPMNFVLIDFWAIDLAFKYQLTLAQRQLPPQDMTELALKTCKMFEAIQYGDEGPPGGVLGSHASLAMAALLLPKNSKNMMWCRRKFALLEQSGYIFPSFYRKRVSELWGVDVSHWWLPDDADYPTTVRTLRDFITYRVATSNDAQWTDERDMSGIFHSMHLEDHSSPDELRSIYTESDQNISP